MKTKILSIALAALMIFSVFAMSGCSGSFHSKTYEKELGDVLTEDKYKDISVTAKISSDYKAYVDAMESADKKNTYVTEEIISAMRALTYKNDDGNTVKFPGTKKGTAVAKNDDVYIYYYILYKSEDGLTYTEYTNLVTDMKSFTLGGGGLLGENFDTALIEKALISGTGHRTTKVAADENKTIAANDVIYVTIESKYKIGEDEKENYKEYNADKVIKEVYDGKTVVRIDLAKLDAPEYADIYTPVIRELVKNATYDNGGTPAGIVGSELDEKRKYEYTKNLVITPAVAADPEKNTEAKDAVTADVTFTVSVQYAATEEMNDDNKVTVTFEGSNTKITDLQGKTVDVYVFIGDVYAYDLSAPISDFSGWFEKAGIEGDGDIEKFVNFIKTMDSTFETDKKEQSEIIEAYRAHFLDKKQKALDAAKEKAAKTALWKYLCDLAAEGIKDEDYPKRAVKQCYKEALTNYKYSYKNSYSGTAANFEEYLMSVYQVGTYDDALKALEADSKAIVLEKMVIMYTANLYDIKISRKEYKEHLKDLESQYKTIWQIYVMYGYSNAESVEEYLGGKDNIYLSMYYNKVIEEIYNANAGGVSYEYQTSSGS